MTLYKPNDHIVITINPETHPMIINIVEELENTNLPLDYIRFLRGQIIKLGSGYNRQEAIDKLNEYVTVKGS